MKLLLSAGIQVRPEENESSETRESIRINGLIRKTK